jgi:hypothetical protein
MHFLVIFSSSLLTMFLNVNFLGKVDKLAFADSWTCAGTNDNAKETIYEGCSCSLRRRVQGELTCALAVQMARSKKACIIFFDEVDAIGGARFDDGAGGDNEVQRTMLEIVNQLDGFDARGNIKVLMATNRPDTLDPALLRPGRLDRKIEFGLPDLKARTQIFKIHTKCACLYAPLRRYPALPALLLLSPLCGCMMVIHGLKLQPRLRSH